MTLTIDPRDLSNEELVRYCGLVARDTFEHVGNAGPHKIVGVTTTVRWDADQDCAVFDLEGVALTVPSAALDAVDLMPLEAQR
jgi:hypothetical protein